MRAREAARPTHRPLGELVDVGGYRLHLYKTGEGSPTVLLEASSGGWSLDWSLVQPGVAAFSRVCSYDRAGFGWSDAGPKPRTSGQIAKELRLLTRNAGVEGPYVLVGASFGGHVVRQFAHENPGQTVGMVLLDAKHEAMSSRMPPAWAQSETSFARAFRFMALLSKIGLLRLAGRWMGDRAAPPGLEKLPDALRDTYLQVGYRSKYFDATLDELAAAPESDAQVRAAGSLGDIPLVVIRHGVPEMFAAMPADQAEKAEAVWVELQAALSRLSSRGRLIVAERSGHDIQLDQPDLVVEAVREVIRAGRRG